LIVVVKSIPCESERTFLASGGVYQLRSSKMPSFDNFIGKVVFKRPLSPTVSFFPCRIEGPLFDTGFSCGAPSAAVRDWHQVARHMHNPNGIIGARSASQLAPDSVAVMGNECLCSSASLSSHHNQKYSMRSNIFVLDRNLPQSGTLKRCYLKTAFPMKLAAR